MTVESLTSKLDNEGGFDKHRIRIGSGSIIRFDRQRLYDTDQLVLTEQLRVLAHKRLELPACGRIPAAEMSKIRAALRYVLGIVA